jgi:hypothetical protein
VCVPHRRWQLDADADQELEYLDLRGAPEVTAAGQAWAKVAQQARQAGAEPGRVFGLAHAVVARWWDQALHWEQEEIWPRRLHQVAGGDAGADISRWRLVGRDAVTFPEVVTVASALLDPVMAELLWEDSEAEKPQPLPPDGWFCSSLGRRVGRPWLGLLAASDRGGPLLAWMRCVVRSRWDTLTDNGRADDPRRVQRDYRPVAMATGLHMLARERKVPAPAPTGASPSPQSSAD